MTRFCALLFFLLLVVPAYAEPVAPAVGVAPRLDTHLMTDVYTTALTFMTPRILEAVSPAQLTIWGLRGLTALDPELSAGLSNGSLSLMSRGRLLTSHAVVPDNDIPGWATTATDLSAAAADASPSVRRAGTEGIVQSFFDELFNHLDPYSRYVAPREAGEDRERRSGQAGAGVTLVRRGGLVTVQEAIVDGPAAIAGIRPGDVIITVDGQSTRGKDATTVSGWITGPEETSVVVVWRGRDGRSHSSELVRAMVPPETVLYQRVGTTLIVQITGFNHSTDSHLAQAIEQGRAGLRPADGLVLDLRGNRGGLLRQAVSAADMMLTAGVVAITAGRDPDASRVWRSVSGELTTGMPVVVIVDGRTASAAEILAAAIADRGRGVVIGSSTLGKGLVQTISPLPDGGELFVTWSRVLAPRGWPIQGLGVLPQVCTSLGQEQLGTELGALAQGRQPMEQAIATHRAARAPLPMVQIQAIRSACPAAEGRDSDLETARFLIQNPAAYAAALLPPLREIGQQSLVSSQANGQ